MNPVNRTGKHGINSVVSAGSAGLVITVGKQGRWVVLCIAEK